MSTLTGLAAELSIGTAVPKDAWIASALRDTGITQTDDVVAWHGSAHLDGAQNNKILRMLSNAVHQFRATADLLSDAINLAFTEMAAEGRPADDQQPTV